jgi:hypothetical protein
MEKLNHGNVWNYIEHQNAQNHLQWSKAPQQCRQVFF